MGTKKDLAIRQNFAISINAPGILCRCDLSTGPGVIEAFWVVMHLKTQENQVLEVNNVKKG